MTSMICFHTLLDWKRVFTFIAVGVCSTLSLSVRAVTTQNAECLLNTVPFCSLIVIGNRDMISGELMASFM